MPKRPWCCPEPRCAPLHVLKDSDAGLQPGASFVCFGKSPEVAFTYDGVEHTNDLRSCHYTPLKGLLAFQENVEDWEAMRSAYGRALAAHRRPPSESALMPSTDIDPQVLEQSLYDELPFHERRRRVEALIAAAAKEAEERGGQRLRGRVKALMGASGDGSEHEHNSECQGESTCPACWVDAIRDALSIDDDGDTGADA